jgi:hypothetical protein
LKQRIGDLAFHSVGHRSTSPGSATKCELTGPILVALHFGISGVGIEVGRINCASTARRCHITVGDEMQPPNFAAMMLGNERTKLTRSASEQGAEWRE